MPSQGGGGGSGGAAGSGVGAGGGFETAASILTNATSAGDAGGRADHFTGSALAAQWDGSQAGAATLSVANSTVAIKPSTATAHHLLTAYTPSGTFTLEMRARRSASLLACGVGLFVRDSGSGDGSGEGVLFQMDWNSSDILFSLFTLDAGVFTSRQSTTVDASMSTINYMKLGRVGTTWTASYSLDRNQYVALATTTKSLTVAKAGFRTSSNVATIGSYDFFDVIV